MIQVLGGRREVITPFWQSATLYVSNEQQLIVEGPIGSTIEALARSIEPVNPAVPPSGHGVLTPRIVTFREFAYLRVLYDTNQTGGESVRALLFATAPSGFQTPRGPLVNPLSMEKNRRQIAALKHVGVPLISVPYDWDYVLVYPEQQIIPYKAERSEQGSVMTGWILSSDQLRSYESEAADAIDTITNSIWIESVGFVGPNLIHGAIHIHASDPRLLGPITYPDPRSGEPIAKNRQIVQITYKVATLEITRIFDHTQNQVTHFAWWRNKPFKALTVGGTLPQEIDLY